MAQQILFHDIATNLTWISFKSVQSSLNAEMNWRCVHSTAVDWRQVSGFASENNNHDTSTEKNFGESTCTLVKSKVCHFGSNCLVACIISTVIWLSWSSVWCVIHSPTEACDITLSIITAQCYQSVEFTQPGFKRMCKDAIFLREIFVVAV